MQPYLNLRKPYSLECNVVQHNACKIINTMLNMCCQDTKLSYLRFIVRQALNRACGVTALKERCEEALKLGRYYDESVVPFRKEDGIWDNFIFSYLI